MLRILLLNVLIDVMLTFTYSSLCACANCLLNFSIILPSTFIRVTDQVLWTLRTCVDTTLVWVWDSCGMRSIHIRYCYQTHEQIRGEIEILISQNERYNRCKTWEMAYLQYYSPFVSILYPHSISQNLEYPCSSIL